MVSSCNPPAVTVMTAVFNAQAEVGAAVESILGQSFGDFEYIIVDDGSTDGTLEVLRSFRDPRIQIVEAGHKGQKAALNEACRRSRAPYIANLDADDMSLPNRLELQVRYMQQHLAVGILGGAYYRVFDNGEIVRRIYPLDDRSIRREMALYGPFCHSAVMYRKAAIEEVGGYDERIKPHGDFELWIRIAAAGYKMANLSEPLVYHRKSPSTYFISSFSRGKRAFSMLGMNLRAIRKLRLARWMYLRAFGRLTWQFQPLSFRPAVRAKFSRIREHEMRPGEAVPQNAGVVGRLPTSAPQSAAGGRRLH